MAVLPNVGSKTCIALILLFLIPLFVKVWQGGKRKRFVEYCIYSGMTFFFFGYHVHEKAILVQLTILQIIAMKYVRVWKISLLLSINAGLSLLPLLPGMEESGIKVTYFLLYNIAYYIFMRIYATEYFRSNGTDKINTRLVCAFVGAVLILDFVIHPFIRHKLEFINLMVYSVSCSVFNSYLYYRMYQLIQ